MSQAYKNKNAIMEKSYYSTWESREIILSDLVTSMKRLNIQTLITKSEMILAIDEALINAMEHGNKWSDNRMIHMSVECKNESFCVTIQDEGNGFNSRLARENLFIESLSQRRRGIGIIHAICIPYWNETGNCITLKFNLRKNS